jgi:hypothetical protein
MDFFANDTDAEHENRRLTLSLRVSAAEHTWRSASLSATA